MAKHVSYIRRAVYNDSVYAYGRNDNPKRIKPRFHEGMDYCREFFSNETVEVWDDNCDDQNNGIGRKAALVNMRNDKLNWG